MKILLSGASGFVGSHILRHLLVNTSWKIICPVTFSHQGLPARLASSVCDQSDWEGRVTIVHWNMRSPADPFATAAMRDCDVFMNVASESHVDRSIAEPGPFVRNNIDLMLNLLELARKVEPRLVLQMSTDEVYGPAHGDYRHKEWDPVIPSNPYSASKAAQEAIAISYWRTYGVPVVITNTMNIVGEMQDPEKFLPMIIRSLRDGIPVPVHVAPDGTPGSRFYLHARNLADAWLWLIRMYTEERSLGTPADPGRTYSIAPALYSEGASRPDRFHIVGEQEISNTSLVRRVGRAMGRNAQEIDRLIAPQSVHAARPGHDLRYALDGTKIYDLGWRAPVLLDDALERTVKWTLEHSEWLDL